MRAAPRLSRPVPSMRKTSSDTLRLIKMARHLSGTWRCLGVGYQPAGNISVAWYAVTRRMVSCFTNLCLVRTEKAFPAGLGIGALACANASRAGLSIIGASTATSGAGGTSVGKLVSIIMRSGHWCAELIRIIDLSNRASAKCGEGAAGQYRSAMKSIAKSMLPTTKKYRPRGILINRAILGRTDSLE